MAEVDGGAAPERDCYPPPDGVEAAVLVGSFPSPFRLKLALLHLEFRTLEPRTVQEYDLSPCGGV